MDRIACPWPITRFIDRDPTVLFVPAADVMKVVERAGATPHDVPVVELVGCVLKLPVASAGPCGRGRSSPASVTIAPRRPLR